MATVSPAFPRRRVVRRVRPTLDNAWDVALADLPAGCRQPMVRYIEVNRAEYRARQELGAVANALGLHWLELDDLARHPPPCRGYSDSNPSVTTCPPRSDLQTENTAALLPGPPGDPQDMQILAQDCAAYGVTLSQPGS